MELDPGKINNIGNIKQNKKKRNCDMYIQHFGFIS